MTTPLWCLLIGVCLPYVWSVASASERKKQFDAIDNKLPRLQQAQLTGLGARAMGAHANAFEALASFAPAVLVAHVLQADPLWSTRLALFWVVARVFHGVAYLLDADKLRSLAFTLGIAATLGLFVLAAQA